MANTLNSNAKTICDQVIENRHLNGVEVHQIGGGTVLDFAVGRPGTLSAGLELAEICMAGLADVSLVPSSQDDGGGADVVVRTDHPLRACMGAQYAGWPFSTEKYFAMCSGPARSVRGKEEVLLEHGLTEVADHSEPVVGVFESNQLPDENGVQAFAGECGVSASQVTICVARTASLPGSLQVVARSLETALHKLHEIGFDLATIRSGLGRAPLPPIAADDLTALGWTNDAVLYGGQVTLWVESEDADVEKVLEQIPSSSSSDFGEPFLKIFERYDRDFYKIDKRLFSPACVTIFNLKSGRTFSAGQVRTDILTDAWRP